LELLHQNGMPTQGLRSKSWDEFAQPSAPALDFVFIVDEFSKRGRALYLQELAPEVIARPHR